MSTVPTIRAGTLTPEYEIRVPGKPEWLPFEKAEPRVDPATGNATSLLIYAGGRMFETEPSTPWPAREAQTAECGHPVTSLYATKMADPLGSAQAGEHFGCADCDEAALHRVKLVPVSDLDVLEDVAP